MVAIFKASADKLKYEMETFGFPPVFPRPEASAGDPKEEKKTEFNPAEVGERKKKVSWCLLSYLW